MNDRGREVNEGSEISIESADPEVAFALHRQDRDGVWSREHRALTAGLALTVTLVAFEALAISTVMPLVAQDLGNVALYGWAFSGFFLGSLVGTVVTGQEIDRTGLVRPFVAGLTLFGIGLVVGGLASSMEILVIARAVQGLGAGAVGPVAYVAIGRSYSEPARPRMFAILSSAWVVPGLAGPALAGAIADSISWRAVFLGLLPFVALGASLTVRSFRTVVSEPAAEGGSGARLARAVGVAVGVGLLLAGSTTPAPGVAAALMIGGVVVTAPPLIGLLPAGALWARRGLPATVLLRGALTFAFFGANVFLPLALVSIRGTSAASAGLALTAATLSWTAGSWIQARQAIRWGLPRLIALGFLALAAGIALSAMVLFEAVPVLASVPLWAIAGLGMGLAYSSTSLLVLRYAAEGRQGEATSSLQLADTLGTTLGAGLAGGIVAFGAGNGWDPAHALLVAFGLAAAGALGGLALTSRVRP